MEHRGSQSGAEVHRERQKLGLMYVSCSVGPCARLKTPTRGYATPIYRYDHPEMRKS